MALDYLEELKKFSAGGGTDINKFLSQHVVPSQPAGQLPVAPPSPPTVPPVNVGAAPVTPAPVGSDTIPSVPTTIAAATPVQQPPAPVVQPSPAPAPAPQGDYLQNENVVRQALRTEQPVAEAGAMSQLPKPLPTAPAASTAAVGDSTAVRRATFNPYGDPTAARDPIASRNLYPPAQDQARMLGLPRRIPMTVVPAATGTSPSQPVKVAEADVPPGAPPYSSGPLANPKPTPSPRPANAIAALPRARNQRMASTAFPRIFANAA